VAENREHDVFVPINVLARPAIQRKCVSAKDAGLSLFDLAITSQNIIPSNALAATKARFIK
jgi:hypothetical protein